MSEDLIKRSDAIKDLCDISNNSDMPEDWHRGVSVAISALHRVPSADRQQGEWKPKNHHTDYCSNCGFEETQWRTADYNYCPSCGARMKGADDE